MQKTIAVLLTLFAASTGFAQPAKLTPARLHEMANAFYDWRNRNYPVSSSDQGLHTWDDRLTDFSPVAIARRHAHVARVAAEVRNADPAKWKKDDAIDWLLFRSQVEGAEFGDRVLQSESRDPQLYVGEASTGIFSLIKKDYAPAQTRALAAEARFRAMPKMFEQARHNLTQPVKLYSQLAIESARAIDPLFNESLEPLAHELTPQQRRDFDRDRAAAIQAAHDFADWLEAAPPVDEAVGGDGGDELQLVPPSRAASAHGRSRRRPPRRSRAGALSRARGAAPRSVAGSPDPARAAHMPENQQAFLAAYQSREQEMIAFLRQKRLVTHPGVHGPFMIRAAPRGVQADEPRRLHEPARPVRSRPQRLLLHPDLQPGERQLLHPRRDRRSAADPRPRRASPATSCRSRSRNHLTDEIRRQHFDTVFVGGLGAVRRGDAAARQVLYPENSAAHGQVLRLTRYRAARIGVDVNLHTGRWSFDQAVEYFMEAGGLDREAARRRGGRRGV